MTIGNDDDDDDRWSDNTPLWERRNKKNGNNGPFCS